jgi:leucyl aminopeptidase
MKISVTSGKLSRQQTDGLVFCLFEDTKKLTGEAASLDKVLGGAISQSIKQGRITGKSGEIEIFHTLGDVSASLIAVIGLGKAKDYDANKLREVSAAVFRTLRKSRAATISIELPESKLPLEAASQAVAEGAVLGLYTFRRHITKKADYPEVSEVNILVPAVDVKKGVVGASKGEIIATAATLARDMANEPSNFMTPADIAGIAKDVAKKNKLGFTLLEKDEMAKLGMNGALSVAQGSAQAPKFMVLKYKGKDSDVIDLALVGKGLTFDSGGISIKPAENMGDMKADMSGAGSVISAISAIAQLKPAINMVAVVAAVENMPSGTAYKPGDIVKAMNGKTIEVVNTDAEGRITLADALSYVNARIKPKNIVDVATLTGACVVALGHVASGIFTNNQALADKVLAAGKAAGEQSWQMPMFDEYKEQNKTDVADMKNSGGRPGGAITAALFLAEFAEETPWVHIDIAGVDLTEKERGYYVKGSTGIPVRTLVELALSMAKK